MVETMWPVFVYTVLRPVVEFHEAFGDVGR